MTTVQDVLRGPGLLVAVRVTHQRGLGAVPAGALSVHGEGAAAGELLGGAVAGPAAALAERVRGGEPGARTEVELGEREAVAAGLACAGFVGLLAHPLPAPAAALLADALGAGRAVVIASDGPRVLVATAAERAGDDLGEAAADAVAAGLRAAGPSTTEVDGVLVDVLVPVPHLVVVGAGALGDALHAQAALLGWTGTTVSTPDEAEQAVAGLGPAGVLVLLDHGPAFDTALLACARGPAFAGALGSRRTQAARRERLAAAGASEADLAAVHGPVGLDLGARTPAETAVSIVAEVVAVRAGREPVALADTRGSIRA